MRKLPLPNFLFAGATRSGTSTLHSLLTMHPDVFMPAKKELHFFDRDDRYASGLDFYRKNFTRYAGQKAVGEATPGYLHANLIRDENDRLYFNPGDTCMARIACSLPDVKIIISLRNPLSRFRSNYEKTLLQRKAGEDELDNVVRAELAGTAGTPTRLHLLYSVRHDIHIAELLRRIPRERVLFLVFEEWTQNTGAALQNIEAFLGISRHFRADFTAPVRNSVSDYKRTPVALLRRKLGLSAAKRQRKIVIPDDIEGQLVPMLRASVQETGRLIGRDLDIWPQFQERMRASSRTATSSLDEHPSMEIMRE